MRGLVTWGVQIKTVLSLVLTGTHVNLTSAGRMSPHRTRTMKDQEIVSTTHFHFLPASDYCVCGFLSNLES